MSTDPDSAILASKKRTYFELEEEIQNLDAQLEKLENQLATNKRRRFNTDDIEVYDIVFKSPPLTSLVIPSLHHLLFLIRKKRRNQLFPIVV
jgi:hypothetical protein